MPQPPILHTLGWPFTELLSVDSTNNYALARIREGLASSGEAWFAHEQVMGKGQRNKKWMAPKDSSLILTLALRPNALVVTEQFRLSITVVVGILQFLKKYVPAGLTIKWPNDIYWGDRKAGGILIENIIAGEDGWKWSAIGMGINLNQPSFPPELIKAVSIRQITGLHYDCLAMAHELCEVLTQTYRRLIENEFEKIYEEYQAMLFKLNETVTLKKDNRRFKAMVKGVDRQGHLIVQHGIEERFRVGEVEWVIT